MANRDDFGFIIAFSELMASLARSVEKKLMYLPTSILIKLLVLLLVTILTAVVFYIVLRKRKPIKVCSFNVPVWIVLSISSVIVASLLLFL